MGPPRVLVVAGEDSSGRAGLKADAQALEHFDAEPVSIATAETDQSGERVHAVRPRDVGLWVDELRALEGGTRVWKSGLLPGAEAVEAFAREVRERAAGRLVVCDPVIAASGGERFLDEEGVERLRASLLPEGVIVTPNLGEAAEICGLDLERLVDDFDARRQAALQMIEMGARAVLLKGGHGGEDPVRDLLQEGRGKPIWMFHQRIPGLGMRGSGCRYASSVAALLATRRPLAEAARMAGLQLLVWIRRASVCAEEGSR